MVLNLFLFKEALLQYFFKIFLVFHGFRNTDFTNRKHQNRKENLKENEERKRNKRQLSKCVVCLTQAELYFYDAFIFFVITQPSCSYKLCFYKKNKYVCIYFAIIKNVKNSNKKNGSVRNCILKYKRQAEIKKIFRSKMAGVT